MKLVLIVYIKNVLAVVANLILDNIQRVRAVVGLRITFIMSHYEVYLVWNFGGMETSIGLVNVGQSLIGGTLQRIHAVVLPPSLSGEVLFLRH